MDLRRCYCVGRNGLSGGSALNIEMGDSNENLRQF